MVQRHKTAIRRNKISRPVNLLLEYGLLKSDSSFFDYGCGHGQDLDLLKKNGFDNVEGWDPHYRPKQKFEESSIVNLGYVLNVIETIEERNKTLKSAFEIANDILCVSVMLMNQKGYDGQRYGDGFVTSKGTFQKYYDQPEIKNYLESQLGVDAIAIEPGIFFVFKSESKKLAYLDSRYCRSTILKITQLDPETHKYKKASVLKNKIDTFVKESPFFDGIISFVLSHGRFPRVEESEDFQNLVFEFKSKNKIKSIVMESIDEEIFHSVKQKRINELLVFFSLRRFDKSGYPKKADLPVPMANDISGLFPSYRAFLDQANELLFLLGNEKYMRDIHKEISIGKVLPDAVYIHPGYVRELPPVIQIKVGVAQKMIGEIEECNLIKINKAKEKVSFMVYEDFDNVAHPKLLYTTVVDLPKMTVKIWDFEERENPPILHRKDSFVNSDYLHYKNFLGLTQAEEKAGLLSRHDIGTEKNWLNLLKKEGLEIRGHHLCRIEPQSQITN